MKAIKDMENDEVYEHALALEAALVNVILSCHANDGDSLANAVNEAMELVPADQLPQEPSPSLHPSTTG